MESQPIIIDDVAVPMSRLVLGTMSFGDTADAATAEAIFEAALAAGVTGVDCANGYARGTTEALIAPLVARHRDEIVLATKVGMPHPTIRATPSIDQCMRPRNRTSIACLRSGSMGLSLVTPADPSTSVQKFDPDSLFSPERTTGTTY